MVPAAVVAASVLRSLLAVGREGVLARVRTAASGHLPDALPALLPRDVRERDGLARSVRERGWLAALVAVATGVQLSAVLRVLRSTPRAVPPPMRDSIIFEYHGWYLARGGRLYVDLWELKPPLPFQTTALLALLAGGDPGLQHALSVAATGAAAVGTVALVGVLVADLTGDRRAALVGGLAVYAHPVAFMRPAYGFKPKYFVALAGLAAVALLLRDRPLAGGAAAAAAAGYWQVGAVFPLVAVGLAVQRGGRRGLARVVAGGGLVAAAVVVPVALDGGLVAMLAQTVVAPLVVGGGTAFGTRAYWLVGLLDLGLAGVLLAAGGVLAVAAGPERRRHWWLPAAWIWLLGHLLLVNVDYYGDLVVLLAVGGVAVGALVGRLLSVRPGLAAWPRPALAGLAGRTVDGSVGRTVGGSAGRTLARSGPGRPTSALRLGAGGDWRLPLHPAAPVVGVVLGLAAVNVSTLGGVAGLAPHPVAEPRPVAEPADVDAPYVGAEQRALYYHRLPPETCRVFVSVRHRAWLDRTGGDLTATRCGRLPAGYRWVRAAVPEPLRGPAPPPAR